MKLKWVIKEKTAKKVARLLNCYGNLSSEITVNNILRRPGGHYIGLEQNRVVGYLAQKPNNFYSTKIYHLCVKPEYRGQGIAKYLVKMLVNKLGRKRPLFFATIDESNLVSQKVFRSLGFRVLTCFINPQTGNKLLVYFFNYQKNA